MGAPPPHPRPADLASQSPEEQLTEASDSWNNMWAKVCNSMCPKFTEFCNKGFKLSSGRHRFLPWFGLSVSKLVSGHHNSTTLGPPQICQTWIPKILKLWHPDCNDRSCNIFMTMAIFFLVITISDSKIAKET